MTNTLSLYLDALRFGAAFTVFVSHWAAARYGGGLFWRAMPFGRTAVLVFFVLSGFVIAWVTETRERKLDEYALCRFARLYSVILPTFAVTAMLDRLGSAIDPRLYEPELALSTTQAVFGYALSAVFLSHSWTLAVLPGSDIPFWSLNYEAWYYVLFGAAVFLRGRRRTVALSATALLAGPKVLLLLPIWLMGVLAWRWRATLPNRWAGLLALGAPAALIVLEALGGQRLFRQPFETLWVPPAYSAYDYVVGALVALFIIGLANASPPVPGIQLQRLIRWFAGTSFGLYLLHYPLLNFFGTVIPDSAAEATRGPLVFGLTLGTALVLARLTEQRKSALKLALRSGFHAVHRKDRWPAV